MELFSHLENLLLELCPPLQESQQIQFMEQALRHKRRKRVFHVKRVQEHDIEHEIDDCDGKEEALGVNSHCRGRGEDGNTGKIKKWRFAIFDLQISEKKK